MYRFAWLFLIFIIFRTATAGEITVNGVYQGKNLFIRNPYLAQEKKFCITEIFVNNIPLGNLPRTSAIQVDLSNLNIKDEVEIRIVHHDGCTPAVVNPEVIQKARDFAFLYVQVDDNSVSWITTGESPAGKFVLEKEKYDGWVNMKEINGKGNLDNNQYSIDAYHYTGSNTYRLIYTNGDNKTFMSEEVTFYSLLEPVIMYPGSDVDNWISLSRETDYEIYNDYDSLILKGFGDEINVSDLDYGDYYIILEDEPVRFNKPKPEIIPRRTRRKSDNGNNK